jgi:hypothetical protein
VDRSGYFSGDKRTAHDERAMRACGMLRRVQGGSVVAEEWEVRRPLVVNLQWAVVGVGG